MSSTPKEKSKVPFRALLGRIFNNSNNGNNGNEPESSKAASISSPTIGHPYNTVHKVHVKYDGAEFIGLPPEWLVLLHRDLSEVDQKENPTAVVTALKFYASAMMQNKDDKFLVTAKSVCPSDDDIDVDLNVNKPAATKSAQADKIFHENSSSSISESVSLPPTLSTSSSEPPISQELPSDIILPDEQIRNAMENRSPVPPIPPARNKIPKSNNNVVVTKNPPPLPPKPK
uniref:CRIB domain-containing protein n=1 Tax=Panagrolaimus sp. PS1159 TaxID=55785 RepID=A0AC35FY36_9BILA